MNTTDGTAATNLRLAGAEDVEWVADLLDTLAEGDLDTTAELLEAMAPRLRKASKVRSELTRVPSATLRTALALRSERGEAGSCP